MSDEKKTMLGVRRYKPGELSINSMSTKNLRDALVIGAHGVSRMPTGSAAPASSPQNETPSETPAQNSHSVLPREQT